MNIEKLFYQLRNWKSHWRAFYFGNYISISDTVAKIFGQTERVRLYGKCCAKIFKSNGKEVDLGCLGSRVVTTAGVNYLRDNFAALSGTTVGNFKYHASGTGVSAEAITDTALGTEVTDNSRATGTQDNSTTKTYVTVGTIAYTGAHAITEHGIFSAVTTGTLWDRTVFSAINVASGDSIQFTYTLTISDGG